VLFACAVALAAAVALAEREREAGMPASHAQQDDGSLCLVAGDPPLVI
jgi:hypothetical protein